MPSRRCAAAAAIAIAFATAAPLSGARADTDPEALVNALNAVFGAHPGKRAAHPSGVCVKGSFTPTDEAAKLSKAPHLTGKGPWPVVGRFSMAGGNPAAPNTQKDIARGLALHIDLGGGNQTDMVMISAPVFAAKTPEKFLELLQTIATKDKAKIDAFFAANPESTRQKTWLNAGPVPAGYATTSYFGVHTFTLTNAEGQSRIIKWQLMPKGGEVGLTDEEAKAKAPDFYKPELTERLAKGSAEFDLTAILGQPGDALDDPTALWPEDRKSVAIGTLSIAALENDAACDTNMFDPTNVVDGIAGPENDGIFLIRPAAYAVSFSRRNQ
ncbi:catalase family peroxidase [Hyphomicrobium sp.]|uniref:catalase family peroxidase n=1 Tax=Hyphomicrobium sp. TaxID=82 RepID=UPI0025C30F4E|nr:catalase family peroxidase [Hyphomicrobium sp.]MCC7252341.1 catalase family peroxidase [Hyphomicrobium sp.]